VLIFSACTEATAPSPVQQNLAPQYGKGAPPPAGVLGNLTAASFDFSGASLAATALSGLSVGGASITTGVLSSAAGIASSAVPVPTFNHPDNYFLGRFDNTQTVALLNVPLGGSKYDLAFDVYAIGSWDGLGKQAQGGAFGSNLFQVGVLCSSAPGTIKDIFTTTFSNQMTVQQNYPNTYGSGGGAKALTNSTASNTLFVGDPTVSVPLFRSVSDATYHMSFTGTNPCGSGAFTVLFRSYSSSTSQTAFDETWGVDNIIIKTDS
jgi:hypothetical protein